MAVEPVFHESMLHLMVQTPYSLYVYWDMAPAYPDLARVSLEGVKPGLALRLIELQNQQSRTIMQHSLPETPLRGNFYFTGLMPLTPYVAELGFLYANGYFTLLQSGTVITPPDGQMIEPQPYNEPSRLPGRELPFAYSPVEAGERGGR
jgi:hypothetical protein